MHFKKWAANKYHFSKTSGKNEQNLTIFGKKNCIFMKPIAKNQAFQNNQLKKNAYFEDQSLKYETFTDL